MAQGIYFFVIIGFLGGMVDAVDLGSIFSQSVGSSPAENKCYQLFQRILQPIVFYKIKNYLC